MEGNGSELASHGEDIAPFDFEPVRKGEFTRAKLGEDDWLILDSLPMTIEGESTRIGVVASCAQIDQTSCVFKAIFAFGIPAMAALIGFRIAKRSLSPIRRIIACADEIAGGNLSRRDSLRKHAAFEASRKRRLHQPLRRGDLRRDRAVRRRLDNSEIRRVCKALCVTKFSFSRIDKRPPRGYNHDD